MSEADKSNPKLVIIIGGKRKCGKDFITDILIERLPDCVVIRNAGPIKEQYAKDHGLDYKQLLGTSEYKEHYRQDMVRWSEEIRKKDPNYFLRLDIERNNALLKPIWIFSDARRQSDMDYFKSDQYQNSKIVSVRISASEEVRKRRGWEYTDGIDNAQTECGLDHYTDWDYVIQNDDKTIPEILLSLQPIFAEASKL